MAGREPSQGYRYCRRCDGEYQPWITTCPECDAPTTSTPPPEPPPVEEPDRSVSAIDIGPLTDAGREALAWRLEVEGIPFEWQASAVVVPTTVADRVSELIGDLPPADETRRRPDTVGDYVLTRQLRKGGLFAWLALRRRRRSE